MHLKSGRKRNNCIIFHSIPNYYHFRSHANLMAKVLCFSSTTIIKMIIPTCEQQVSPEEQAPISHISSIRTTSGLEMRCDRACNSLYFAEHDKLIEIYSNSSFNLNAMCCLIARCGAMRCLIEALQIVSKERRRMTKKCSTL